MTTGRCSTSANVRARVADIESQVVGDRHVLDGVVQALAGVAGLEDPVGVMAQSTPVTNSCCFMGFMLGEMAGSRGSALVARKSTFSMKRPDVDAGRRTAGRATAADG